MLASDGKVKLSDFGCAKRLKNCADYLSKPWTGSSSRRGQAAYRGGSQGYGPCEMANWWQSRESGERVGLHADK